MIETVKQNWKVAVLTLLLIVGAGAGVWQVLAEDEPGTMDRACQNELGSEWEAGGWIGSHPPAITCHGPIDGQVIIEMPKHAREEAGLLLLEDVRENGSQR